VAGVWPGPRGPADVLFWSNHPTERIDVSETIGRKVDALRAHGSQIKHPDQLDERMRAWARDEGAAIGVEAGEAFYMAPGHAPEAVEGTELIQFSPAEQLAEVEAAMAAALQNR
jgi:LmbE family N-acetylglucosaminyl deacetylase